MENSINDFNEYREDKILKHTPINDCTSDCCGAPANSDILICSECQEHCEEHKSLCYGCEKEIDDDDVVCDNSNCWNLYKSEHFYND